MTLSKHGMPKLWTSVSLRVHICATEYRQLITYYIHSISFLHFISLILRRELTSSKTVFWGFYDFGSENTKKISEINKKVWKRSKYAPLFVIQIPTLFAFKTSVRDLLWIECFEVSSLEEEPVQDGDGLLSLLLVGKVDKNVSGTFATLLEAVGIQTQSV